MGLIPPTSPVALISPSPAESVKSTSPPATEINTILPIPAPVSKEVLPNNVSGELKVIVSFVVVKFPDQLTVAAPLSVKGPSKEIAPGPVLDKVPPPVTTNCRGPEFVVVIEPFRVMLADVIEIPAAPLVVTAPLKVVVPVPAVC